MKKSLLTRMVSCFLLCLSVFLFSCGKAPAVSPETTGNQVSPPTEETMHRVSRPLETVKESDELEAKLEDNVRKKIPYDAKVILTCGEQRDVPYIYTGYAHKLGSAGHMETVDGYAVFGWHCIDHVAQSENYPTFTVTPSDTLTLYVNDEVCPFAEENDAGVLTRGLVLLSAEDGSEVGTFKDLSELADLPKGKYYAGVDFICYGDFVRHTEPYENPEGDPLSQQEKGMFRGCFILELT